MAKKQVFVSGVILIGLLIGGIGYAVAQRQAQPANRPVATTMAQVAIFDRLGVPLAAVPTSQEPLPARYAQLPKVGNHVSVNFEQILRVHPSVVYVDAALTADYATKLKASQIKMTALDFTNYQQLTRNILQLGMTYHQVAAAQKLLRSLKLPPKTLKKPVKVLILVGMPGGGFLVANAHSYLGDLVKRAGGEVVGGDVNQPLTTPNPQAIAQENPAVVIRLAHAMPTQVKQSFDQIFQQAPYAHLKATQSGQIHDVSAPDFGMTANLQVVTAYRDIQQWLAVAQ
ncbi:ABC transporter substrate-binding protein [Leuconostoc lactis]|uniref:ABC transporter substrate-binding protein n=1 Tax=Leuconostoc lactis TaxID=1246 RepID=UPI00374597BB